MTKSLRNLQGWWPKFSEYVLVEDKICPMPGARLEKYDPWEEYEIGKRRGDSPPYLELFRIFDDLRPEARDGYADDEVRRILDWTRRHGLLGILRHRMMAVSENLDEMFRMDFVAAGPRCKDGQWCLGSIEDDDDYDEERHISRQFLCRDDASFYELFDEEQDIWIPNLDCDEFLKAYCEPLNYWFGEVRAFREAIQKQNDVYLNTMLAKIQVEYSTESGTPQIRNTFFSLLGALALMYAQDQIAGYRILRCVGCGSQIVTSAYQAQFCSRTCGDRYRKRRSRERAMHAQKRRARRRPSHPNRPPE